MARIAGINLPNGKHIWIALTAIYGIGPTRANKICSDSGVDRTKKVKDLDEKEFVLVIANEDGTPFFGENQGVITSKDSTFTYARWTDKSSVGENRLMSPLVALHWSLCRDEKDLHENEN